MLKINFISESSTTENVNALFTSVNYEKNLMFIQLNNDDIAKCEKIIANKSGTKTDEEIKAATAKKIKLEEDNRRLEEENKDIEDIYKNTLSEIAAAANEYTINDYNAVRNVLRLVACGDNRKFFRIAIVTDVRYAELYDGFSAFHKCEEADFDENGIRISDKKKAAMAKKLVEDVQAVIKQMFSIPIENAYTKKVNVKFNKTDMGILHECFVRGVDVNVIKKSKNDTDMSFCGYTIKTAITKKQDSNGNITHEGKSFNELLAKLAFQYICG